MRTKRQLILVALIVLLGASGCVTFDVINLAETNARVLLQIPDQQNGVTRSIPPAGSTSTFSTHGGSFSVRTLPDEQYRQLLNDLEAEISRRLWDERETLTAEDVARLVRRLEDVNSQLERLSEIGASCSGTAPDFAAVTIILSWDLQQQNWYLECSVATDE